MTLVLYELSAPAVVLSLTCYKIINMSKWEKNEPVQRLREYLKIPSVHPDPDYGDCVKFLEKQAQDLCLPISVYEFVPAKPIVVISWLGTEPHLPAILLNSHMDVVPVYEEHWTYPPFEAHITEEGMLYARGVQDMKSVGMMHLEAVRNLKDAGVRLRRTVHVSFVPDEEIGSQDGMRVFSESEVFKRMNIGFELDESAPHHASNEVYAFNGERTSRQIKLTCRGKPSHGSFLEPNTAGEKIHYVINKFMEYRAEEKKKLDSGVPLGDVTTINLTQLEGGVQINVLPESLSVSFDIRIAPQVDHKAFEKMINNWCKEAGEGVTYEYLVKNPEVKSTRVDSSEPFWTTLETTLNNMGIKVNCIICPGATDARFVRIQGIPAINLTPIRNSPVLLHCHDERLEVQEYIKAIGVMEKIVEAVANVE